MSTPDPAGRTSVRRPLVILAIAVGVTAVVAAAAGPGFGPGGIWGETGASGPVASATPGRSTTGAGFPSPTTLPTALATQTPLPTPGGSPRVTPLPGGTPTREPIDLLVVGDPARPFISEQQKTWCAPAGIQMVLAVLGFAEPTPAFQAQLASRISEWESPDDSHNDGWGPEAMTRALAAYGAAGYEVRVLPTRADAMRAAAAAIETTGAPAIILAWRGAHTWVMSGFRADADPVAFSDATILGAYILDPWYPRVSSIWGPSDPPGTYQDAAELIRNFLPWKRPEGRYPDRDGRFIVVVPTIPLDLPESGTGSGG